MLSRIRQTGALGQAIWVDYISRELLRSGKLRDLVSEGVTGVTSNPSIFHKAITTGSDYDPDLRALALQGRDAQQIYEALAISDIREATELLRPVYNETHARDGFVSLEVSPRLAHDTSGTIVEARRLWKTVDRPNLMIKVPATPAGLPAISTLIGEGINVNVTLIFAIEVYEQVMQAYLEGLRRLRAIGRPLALVSSVASFFVSRVDTLIDGELQKRTGAGEDHLEPLLGRAAVANAKLAYTRFRSVFETEAFAELRAAGGRVQRPLWASTSTKNPSYPGLKYFEPLIGPFTVNTLPLQTLELVRESALPAQTLEQDASNAAVVFDQLDAVGISIREVTATLLDQGVAAFADSFDKLLTDIDAKRQRVVRAA